MPIRRNAVAARGLLAMSVHMADPGTDAVDRAAGAALMTPRPPASESGLHSWRTRALEAAYALVFIDSVIVRIREDGLQSNKRIHIAVGILPDGSKDIIAFWIETSCAKGFWSSAILELRERGICDISLAVVEDPDGCGKALGIIFPETRVQASVEHFVRRATAFVTAKERQNVAKELRRLFAVEDRSAAAAGFNEFATTEPARRHPSVAEFWRERWDEMVSFFELPLAVRLAVCNNSAVDSVIEKLRRRGLKRRASFPNAEAAIHEMILVLRDANISWKVAPNRWLAVKRELDILEARA
jgi:putative transposase